METACVVAGEQEGSLLQTAVRWYSAVQILYNYYYRSVVTLIQYLFTRKFQTAMGFVWRLPGQNKGFPYNTGLVLR